MKRDIIIPRENLRVGFHQEDDTFIVTAWANNGSKQCYTEISVASFTQIDSDISAVWMDYSMVNQDLVSVYGTPNWHNYVESSPPFLDDIATIIINENLERYTFDMKTWIESHGRLE